MRFKRILYILPALFFLLASASSADELKDVLSRLQEKYNNIASVEADFTQEAYQKGFNATQRSDGKVYFKKPGKMRWEYKEPLDDLIVSNGKMIWVYQPDLDQAIEKPVEGAASSMATDFLSGMGNLKRDFKAALTGSEGGAYRITLVPKQAQPNMKRLVLEIDKNSMLLVKTTVIDHFGNETRVELKDIKTNIPLKDSIFEFTPPKGATVVRP